MTLNEKIVDSVSKTTGIRCFEGMPPDGIVGRFAYFFPLRSGAAKRYNEVAIFFMERPVFTPLSPEKATNDCRYLALNWLNGLYAYSGLKFQDILSQNNTRDGFGGYGVGLRLVLVDEARHTGGATPVDKKNYFRMTADGTSAVVGWIGTYPYLEYRKEGDEWTDFTQNVTFYTWIEFRLKEGSTWSPTSNSNHFSIQTEGADDHVILSGNIMSLVDPTLESTTIPSNYCFYCLFYNCKTILSAVDLELPATTLGSACYACMFLNCTSLTTAPSILSATRLSSYCYSSMFNGCSSLTTAPELPATTLAYNCYSQMFYNCTALTQAPELPATTLAENCYDSMFENCTSLTTAPELPATTLAQGCYRYMFFNCTGLTSVELPATTLANNCYEQMFYGCRALTTAPDLPATTLAQGCYSMMFYNCSSLNEMNVDFNSWSVYESTSNWVGGVSATGTFTCTDDLSIEHGDSRIPTGWRVVKPTMYNVLAVSGDQTMGSVTGGGSYAVGDTVTLTATALDGYNFVNWTVNNVEVSTSETYTFTVSQNTTVIGNFEEAAAGYLTFTALEDNSSVGWYASKYPNLEYSTDGSTWTAFTEPVSVNTGGKVMFRNNGTAWTATNANSHFTTTGSFELSGVLMSLVDSTAQATTIGTVSNIFAYLFTGCGIVNAGAIELPTNTYLGCYYHMFENCTSLVDAPVLPALICAPQCYSGMFRGCSSLGYLEAMFTTKPKGDTMGEFTYGWLDGVAATGTFVKNTDATWVNTTVTNPNSGFVYEVIPSGWTIQCPLIFTALTAGSTVKIMAQSSAPSINISYAMDDEWKGGGWHQYQVGDTITLDNVGDKVSFGGDGINNYKLASSSNGRNYFVMTGSISAGGDVTSLLNGYGGDYQMTEGGETNAYCFYGLFRDCTALVKAPNLPSTKLANYSYQRMFYGCTNLVTPPAELNAVTCSVGDNSNYMYRDVYSQMFYGCTSLVNTPHMKGIGNSRSTYARTPGNAASQMFYNCTSLRNIYASGTWILGIKGYNSSTTTYSCSGWMQNVPQNVGTIHLPNTSGYSGFDDFLNNRGNSGAPVGWSVSYDISI